MAADVRMSVVFIYITHPEAGKAEALGHVLVENGVAACVNLIPGMKSIYRWQGEIETASETVMIVKTSAAMVERVQALVRKHHPYECPCIAVLPITGGDPAYLDWIAQSLAAEG